ncbi:hypothetical protein AB0C32_42440, partial [Streptosporangium sp. NPDC048865]
MDTNAIPPPRTRRPLGGLRRTLIVGALGTLVLGTLTAVTGQVSAGAASAGSASAGAGSVAAAASTLGAAAQQSVPAVGVPRPADHRRRAVHEHPPPQGG